MNIETIILLISTVFNLVAGGGWFINHRLKKRAEKANTELNELKTKEANFDYYLRRIADLEKRLVEAELKMKDLECQLEKSKK